MWKDILKKNAISIACGVVALIAVVLIFFPADQWITDLQSKLDERKSVNNTLATLANKSRSLPILDPNATAATPMRQFPSETIIAQGLEATKAVKLQSQKLFQVAVDLNQRGHALLVNNSLPKSGEVPKLQFRGAYAAAFKFGPDRQTPQLPDYNIPVSILKATQPPTAEEIAAAQEGLWNDKYVQRIVLVGGQPANAPQVSADYVAEASKLPEVLRQSRATESKIYMMPGALQINPAIQNVGMPPREEDIWSAQLSLWIQTDVARAIAATNANSRKGILDAPVKQLVQLVVAQGASTASSSAGANAPVPGRPPVNPFGGPGFGGPGFGGMEDATGGGTAASGAKVSDPAELLTFDFVTGPTGRVSSGLYDVYDFQLTVDVDAAQLPALITELTRNQYVTVRWLNFTPVDLDQLKAAGFLYGSEPVVRAVLYCETLFMRKWTEPLMPDRVKAALGIAAPAAPEGAGTQ
jgi:hypothetical protein